LPRADYIFAVEAVDVFRRLGPVVLKYVLRAYEGRLSKLVLALRSWARQIGHSTPPDARLVADYISATFGPRHHVTSLTRYALSVNAKQQMSRPQIGHLIEESQPANFDPRQRYAPGSQFSVLSNMHDYNSVLRRIQAAPNETCLL